MRPGWGLGKQMNLRNVGIVYRKELRDALRDRRTLISMILVPLLIFPVMILGFSMLAVQMIGAAKKEIPKVMVLGGDDSPSVAEGLRQLKTIDVVPTALDYAQQISDKRIRAAVNIPAGFQAGLESGQAPAVTIYMYEGDLKSSFAVERIEKYFDNLREQVVRQRLAAHALPEDLTKPFSVVQRNLAPPEKVFGATFGGLIGYMVILLCMTGAIYPAIDLTAGEKERGTMETILCAPVARTDLVLAKFLTVLTASLSSAALAVLSMSVSFGVISKLPGASRGADQAFPQMVLSGKAIVAVFVMALPMAVLFSAVLLTVALFAKTYKEAQSYLTPLTFVVVIPAVASLLPGMELNPRLALIPILNTSLVNKELVTGTYHWSYIFMILGSSCVYAAIALAVAVKMFQREEVLFRT
jgi:sodium transport system permease protein